MKRFLISTTAILPLVALMTASLALAEVKTREKTQLKFEGMLGRMIGMFGGKAVKEGLIASTAVKGNRKATMDEETGQIIDLSEEKIYDLDIKKKTYKVTTFEEFRRKLQEEREKAEREAAKEQGKPDKPQQTEKPAKEIEIDFDVKDTGQKKPIAGYDTHEVIMTITVREKGKTLEEAGGLVMTTDSWIGPRIPALKELADFQVRYWKQLQGSDAGVMSPEQMAMVVSQYPMVKDGMERLQKEGSKLEGTPLATTTTFESAKSKEQMAAEADNSKSSSSGSSGLSGMLARKMMKKEGEAKPRVTILTTTHEFLEVATTVATADLDIPAGFKEKR